MKIAICTNHFSPSIGGCETVVRKISEYLSIDHKVFVFTRRLPGRKHVDFLPINIVEYSQGDISGFLSKVLKVLPDIIFIYSDVFDFFKTFLSVDFKPKIIIALCGANWLYENKAHFHLLNRRIRNIKSFVCHSEYDRDYKLCSSPHIISKTQIIPNGVDLQEFDGNNVSRDTLAERYKVDKNLIWILNVSNFFPGKGQSHLVDIMKVVNDKRFMYIQVSNDIGFSIGELLENEWKKKVKISGINAKLLKNLPRKDVVALFRSSNVLAFTTEKEVAPLVLLEAMAAKLAWTSTNVGNAVGLKGGLIVNALKDRRFYNIFDNRVINLFAQSIIRANNDPALSHEGRQQVEQNFTWDVVLPQYKRLIESCN